MIREGLLAVLVVLAASFPAAAEIARVKSGEHADFTRLVVQAPGVKDWSFGRSTDGYELRLDSGAWEYDVTSVFDLIPRTRLASISGDPASGNLRLGIACECHAIPFEFRPGLIVIDLRDGPPPRGSAFETALEIPSAPAVSVRPEQRPDPPAAPSPPLVVARYNWLDDRLTASPVIAETHSEPSLDLPLGEESLNPLRQALLAQMSIGLSNGVIDLADPGHRPDPATALPESSDWSRVVLGEAPGTTANLDVEGTAALTPKGTECIPDDSLDLQEWSKGDQVSGTIGEIRQGLVKEFDRPDHEAVDKAAKSLIYLGFGAEARQVMEAFPSVNPQADRSILFSLARLVDGQRDDDGPFAAMAGCDTTVALWAALSGDLDLAPQNVNEPALRRGFSALPPHLRRALGPGLIERFLEADNQSAVLALRDALARGNADEDSLIAMVDARIELSEGRAKEAEQRAAETLADPGPATAEAVLALVDAQIAQNVVTDVRTVTMVEALLEEQAGTAQEPALRRALVLARFGAEDVPGAFAALKEASWVSEELWTLLAERASDSALLAQAVIPQGGRVDLPSATTSLLAERLLGLGLATPALRWLGEPDVSWDAARHLLYSQALLSTGAAQDAMASVADPSTPEAAMIVAQAMTALGLEGDAASAYDAAGDPKKAAAARSLAGDWGALAKTGPQDWKAAALRLASGRMETVEANRTGALARGMDLVGHSEADRGAVEALLQAIPMPLAAP